MKKLLVALFIFVAGFGYAQKINWMTMNQALEAQKKSPKKIFVDVYTDWCGPCKMLDKNTFSNPDVIKYINEKFYAVKFNAEGEEKVNYQGQTYTNPDYDPAKAGSRNATNQFAIALGVRAYPTVYFFDEKGNALFPLTGYYGAKDIEPMLKLLGENTYLKVKTNEEYNNYLKNFKGTFKD
ncbi:MAG: thioredoxin family protein [Capnocytophaga sp.]|nr:thioredoxin family protein [Capnocytophaga sp.]